jgi:uncharacterized protein (DUF1684 family)
MKKPFILLILLCISTFTIYGQNYKEEIKQFQEKLNKEYKNPDESPLSKKEIENFKGHTFFPINDTFRIEAKFQKFNNPVFIKMKTSSEKIKDYDKFGMAEFEIKGQTFKLVIYQSHRLREMKKYKDHLFLPFTDLTNGFETYGGGRYLDLTIPKGNTIIIDFNKAYNPYCAYSKGYSCPIPPEENDLKIRIEAGVMNQKIATH